MSRAASVAAAASAASAFRTVCFNGRIAAAAAATVAAVAAAPAVVFFVSVPDTLLYVVCVPYAMAAALTAAARLTPTSPLPENVTSE